MGQVLFLAAIAVGAIVINALATVDFNQNGSFILLTLFKEVLYLCALVIGLMVVSLRSLENPQVDQRAAPWVLYGILIGIGIFLIHNLIEFSMFEAGPTCLLGVLIGSALGVRLANRTVRIPGISIAAIAGLAAVAALWLAAAYWIAVPVSRAEAATHRGDEKLRAADVQTASDEYGYAATILPINAEYAFRAGRALHLSIGPPALLTNPDQIDRAIRFRTQIESWYDIATDRDPAYLAAYHLRAILNLQLGDAKAMVEDFDEVMDLNPNEVALRLEYARALEMLHLPREAKKQYQLALKYDDQLDKAEPKRLSPSERADIAKEIAGLPN
jgi:tetratricopeptide (TPR) repeat protein